jgi:hypothetical protein
MPKDRDFFAEGRIGSGMQFSRSTVIVDLSASAGIRFGGEKGNRPFTLVGSINYYRDALGTDDRRVSYVDKAGAPNLAWSGVTQAFYQFHRQTKGGSIELGYEPNADTRLYVRYLNTGYQEEVVRNQFAIKAGNNGTANADGTITSSVKQLDKSVRDMLQRVRLHLTEVGGHNKLGDLALAYHASYAQGQDYRPYDTVATFSSKPANTSITYGNAGAAFPTYAFTGTDAYNPANYTLSGVTNNNQLYRTREWSGGLDGTLSTRLTGSPDEKIKFGVAARLRTNTHIYTSYASTAAPAVNMAGAATGQNILFDQAHYANGPNIDVGYVNNLWQNGAGAGFATSNAANAFASGLVQQDNRENVYAGYVQERPASARFTCWQA